MSVSKIRSMGLYHDGKVFRFGRNFVHSERDRTRRPLAAAWVAAYSLFFKTLTWNTSKCVWEDARHFTDNASAIVMEIPTAM